MSVFKDQIGALGESMLFITEMLDQFVCLYVDLNQTSVKKERQVGILENKLGSMHSIDYEAQRTAINLKDELDDLKKALSQTEAEKEKKIQGLQ